MQDYNLGPSVSIGAVGDKYDSTATYAVGDYCIYDDKLYKCNTAISTAEAWNASHWTDTTIAEVLQTIPSVVDNLTTDDATKVLSAKQGKNLKDQIPGVVNNLTSDSTTSALSAAQGKALNSNINSISVQMATLTAGNLLTSGSDLLDAPVGVWSYRSADNISNTPCANGLVRVYKTSSSTQWTLIIVNDPVSTANVYINMKAGSWSGWKKITATAV